MRFLPPNVAALAKICPKENHSKYALTHVHYVEQHDRSYMVEATDTRILARITGSQDFKNDAHPMHTELAALPNGGSSALIPAAIWKGQLTGTKAQANAGKVMPIVKCTGIVASEPTTHPTATYQQGGGKPVIKEGPAVQTVSFGSTTLEERRVKSLTVEAGRFPPVDDILPKRKPTASVTVSAALLRKLLDVASEVSDVVTIELRDASPLMVRCTGDGKAGDRSQAFTGLLMHIG